MTRSTVATMPVLDGPRLNVAIALEPVSDVVGLDADHQGTLVVSWFTPTEAGYYRSHHGPSPESIRPFVRRASVAGIALRTLLGGAIVMSGRPVENVELVPVVMWDGRASFWSSFLDGSPAMLAAIADAPVTDGHVTMTLRLTSRTGSTQATPAPCVGPRFEHRVIADRNGDNHRVCVRTPVPAHRHRGQRVVYMLPGLGGRESVRFEDRLLTDAIDAWSDATQIGVLLVGVDTSAPSGSRYVGTAHTIWTRFLTDDLVAAVEREFGAPPSIEHRVIAGQSSGGFNAVMLALAHPGVFGTVIASAPDALDFDNWLLTPEGEVKDTWVAWMRLEDAIGGRGVMRSYADNWSAAATGHEWPVTLRTGEVREEQLQRWLSHSPARLLDQPEIQTALRALDGRLFIGAATRDEFGLFEPTERFSDRLHALGIAHHLVPDNDGHFDAQRRLARLIRAALDTSAAGVGQEED